MVLDEVKLGTRVTIIRVSGERFFRRRLLEMGLLPGVTISPKKRAPLGDPIEVAVRGGRISIRRAEARCIEVK